MQRLGEQGEGERLGWASGGHAATDSGRQQLGCYLLGLFDWAVGLLLAGPFPIAAGPRSGLQPRSQICHCI
jgi:hypothetical protein